MVQFEIGRISKLGVPMVREVGDRIDRESKCLRLRFGSDCLTGNRKSPRVRQVGVGSGGGEKYKEPKARSW